MIEILLFVVPIALIIGVGRLFISTGDEYYIPSTKKNTK